MLGMLVAKLVEYCHERASISDNASDMSDYTRELLKAQLMLAFNKGKKNKKGKPEDIARKYGKLWFGKMMRNKARRIKAGKEAAENKTSSDSTGKNNLLTVPSSSSVPAAKQGIGRYATRMTKTMPANDDWACHFAGTSAPDNPGCD